MIPTADLAIYIEAEDDSTRQVLLQAHTACGQRLLQGIASTGLHGHE
jgi:hypothetical protein